MEELMLDGPEKTIEEMIQIIEKEIEEEKQKQKTID